MESGILSALGIDPGIIIILLFLLIIALFVLYVNVTMKYNRLKSSYNTFMKGKDGKTLEESFKERFSEVEAILKITKQNRLDIREMSKHTEKNYQKMGIVKYDAFNEMGGKLSFCHCQAGWQQQWMDPERQAQQRSWLHLRQGNSEGREFRRTG